MFCENGTIYAKLFRTQIKIKNSFQNSFNLFKMLIFNFCFFSVQSFCITFTDTHSFGLVWLKKEQYTNQS